MKDQQTIKILAAALLQALESDKNPPPQASPSGGNYGNPPKTASRPSPRCQPPARTLPPLPGFMKRLDIKCHQPDHWVPFPTKFLGFTEGKNGRPVAEYRCDCGVSQFFGLSPEGKAFKLFTKKY